MSLSVSAASSQTINGLNRAEIQSILESNGYQVYDSESTDDLRDCLRADVEQGIIAVEDLSTSAQDLPDCRDR
jgi:hypothetical protein